MDNQSKVVGENVSIKKDVKLVSIKKNVKHASTKKGNEEKQKENDNFNLFSIYILLKIDVSKPYYFI